MSDDLRIYIEDKTGREIASPEDSATGGSVMLKGKDAATWRKANPDLAIQEKPEPKAAAKAEDKAVKKSEAKAKE